MRCCGNLLAVLLVLGVMDLRAMALVGALVALERLVPAAVRPIGAGLVCLGLLAFS